MKKIGNRAAIIASLEDINADNQLQDHEFTSSDYMKEKGLDHDKYRNRAGRFLKNQVAAGILSMRKANVNGKITNVYSLKKQ